MNTDQQPNLQPEHLHMNAPRLRRPIYDLVVTAVLVASVGLIAIGDMHLETNTEDALSWLPDQSPARDSFEYFHQHFGADDFVVLPVLLAIVDSLRERLAGESSESKET